MSDARVVAFAFALGRTFGFALECVRPLPSPFRRGVAPIVLNTLRGLVEVPRRLVDVGRAANCTSAQLFWKVQFPAAVPTVFTGIRLGIIYTLVNVIGIEFLINFGGLGNLVSATYDRFDIPGMYAAIVFIVLLSAVYFAVLGAVQTRIRPT